MKDDACTIISLCVYFPLRIKESFYVRNVIAILLHIYSAFRFCHCQVSLRADVPFEFILTTI